MCTRIHPPDIPINKLPLEMIFHSCDSIPFNSLQIMNRVGPDLRFLSQSSMCDRVHTLVSKFVPLYHLKSFFRILSNMDAAIIGAIPLALMKQDLDDLSASSLDCIHIVVPTHCSHPFMSLLFRLIPYPTSCYVTKGSDFRTTTSVSIPTHNTDSFSWCVCKSTPGFHAVQCLHTFKYAVRSLLPLSETY